jgi:hypothetical protein
VFHAAIRTFCAAVSAVKRAAAVDFIFASRIFSKEHYTLYVVPKWQKVISSYCRDPKRKFRNGCPCHVGLFWIGLQMVEKN